LRKEFSTIPSCDPSAAPAPTPAPAPLGAASILFTFVLSYQAQVAANFLPMMLYCFEAALWAGGTI